MSPREHDAAGWASRALPSSPGDLQRFRDQSRDQQLPVCAGRPVDPWEAARRRAEEAARANLAAIDAELAALGSEAEPAERQRLLGRRGTAQHELHTTLYLEDWFRGLRRHPRRYAEVLAQVKAR